MTSDSLIDCSIHCDYRSTAAVWHLSAVNLLYIRFCVQRIRWHLIWCLAVCYENNLHEMCQPYQDMNHSTPVGGVYDLNNGNEPL